MSHSEVLIEVECSLAKFCHVDAQYESPMRKVNADIIACP